MPAKDSPTTRREQFRDSQRRMRQRRRERGEKLIQVWMPGEMLAALRKECREEESLAGCILRVLDERFSATKR